MERFFVRFVSFFDEVFKVFIAFWIDVGEGNVGHFDAKLTHVKSVGERGKNFKRFFGNFLLFVGRKGGKSAEIVKAVGKFDNQDANVSTEGDEKAKKIVASFGEIGIDVTHTRASDGKFCDAVDKKSNRFAEFVFNVVEGDRSIFDGVMENAGNNRIFVHTPSFENFLYGERMIYEGFTAFAELAFVGFFRESDCFFDSFGHGIIIT